jgi:hypothetical protein
MEQAMKYILMIFLFLSLLSVAPVPTADRRRPTTSWAPLTVVIHAPPRAQACTWETAPARLRQQIEDPVGYPFGFVQAFSCDGDTAAVVAELASRAAEMQAAAAAYRASHPIKESK